MKKFVNLRNTQELQDDLHKVRDILGIDQKLYGCDPEAVRKSLKFVIEFNGLVWNKFLNDYPPTIREVIRKKLLNC